MTVVSESLVIRPATSADVAALARVHLTGWQVGYRGLLPDDYLNSLTVEDYERRWADWLAQGGRTLLADRGSSLVAFASIGLISDDVDADNTTGELRGLYAVPAAWGTGAGKAVHDAALAALRAVGLAQATLWTFSTNERAIAFYDRQGWAPDGLTKTDTSRGFPLAEIRYRRGLDV